MNRRSLITLIIGVLSTLAGLMTAAYVERRRCLGAGGRWAGNNLCHYADSTSAGFSAMAILVGGVAAIVIGFVLFRALLFVTGKATRPSAQRP